MFRNNSLSQSSITLAGYNLSNQDRATFLDYPGLLQEDIYLNFQKNNSSIQPNQYQLRTANPPNNGYQEKQYSYKQINSLPQLNQYKDSLNKRQQDNIFYNQNVTNPQDYANILRQQIEAKNALKSMQKTQNSYDPNLMKVTNQKIDSIEHFMDQNQFNSHKQQNQNSRHHYQTQQYIQQQQQQQQSSYSPQKTRRYEFSPSQTVNPITQQKKNNEFYSNNNNIFASQSLSNNDRNFRMQQPTSSMSPYSKKQLYSQQQQSDRGAVPEQQQFYEERRMKYPERTKQYVQDRYINEAQRLEQQQLIQQQQQQQNIGTSPDRRYQTGSELGVHQVNDSGFFKTSSKLKRTPIGGNTSNVLKIQQMSKEDTEEYFEYLKQQSQQYWSNPKNHFTGNFLKENDDPEQVRKKDLQKSQYYKELQEQMAFNQKKKEIQKQQEYVEEQTLENKIRRDLQYESMKHQNKGNNNNTVDESYLNSNDSFTRVKGKRNKQTIDTIASQQEQKSISQFQKKKYEKQQQNSTNFENSFNLPRTPPNNSQLQMSQLQQQQQLYQQRYNQGQPSAQPMQPGQQVDQEIIEQIINKDNTDLDYLKEYYDFQKKIFSKQLIKMKEDVSSLQYNHTLEQKNMLDFNERQMKQNYDYYNTLKPQSTWDQQQRSRIYHQQQQQSHNRNNSGIVNFPDLNHSYIDSPLEQKDNVNQLQNKSQVVRNRQLNNNKSEYNFNNSNFNDSQQQQQYPNFNSNNITTIQQQQQQQSFKDQKLEESRVQNNNNNNDLAQSRFIESREIKGTERKRKLFLEKLEQNANKRLRRRNSDVYKHKNLKPEKPEKDLEDQDPEKYQKDNNEFMDILDDLQNEEESINTQKRCHSSHLHKKNFHLYKNFNEFDFIKFYNKRNQKPGDDQANDREITGLINDIQGYLTKHRQKEPEKKAKETFQEKSKQQKTDKISQDKVYIDYYTEMKIKKEKEKHNSEKDLIEESTQQIDSMINQYYVQKNTDKGKQEMEIQTDDKLMLDEDHYQRLQEKINEEKGGILLTILNLKGEKLDSNSLAIDMILVSDNEILTDRLQNKIHIETDDVYDSKDSQIIFNLETKIYINPYKLFDEDKNKAKFYYILINLIKENKNREDKDKDKDQANDEFGWYAVQLFSDGGYRTGNYIENLYESPIQQILPINYTQVSKIEPKLAFSLEYGVFDQ